MIFCGAFNKMGGINGQYSNLEWAAAAIDDTLKGGDGDVNPGGDAHPGTFYEQPPPAPSAPRPQTPPTVQPDDDPTLSKTRAALFAFENNFDLYIDKSGNARTGTDGRIDNVYNYTNMKADAQSQFGADLRDAATYGNAVYDGMLVRRDKLVSLGSVNDAPGTRGGSSVGATGRASSYAQRAQAMDAAVRSDAQDIPDRKYVAPPATT